LSVYYEKGKTIEDIVGFGNEGKFIHYKTGKEETVFEYMLRHTVAKPRDLIRIAYPLKTKITPTADTEARIEELRTTTNEAAEKVAEDIFTEKARFLGCLQNKNERNRFLSLIPKNTLSQKTVYNICREFNKKTSKCSGKQCLKNKEANSCSHPFCELNNIGLFGHVTTDAPIIQKFEVPDTDHDIYNHITGLYSYYIVHPSLCEIIKRLRFQKSAEYIVTPGITTGNGYIWGERESEISDLIDFVLDEKLPQEEEKEIIKNLKDKIRDTVNIKELTKRIKNKIHNIKKKKKIFLSYCGKDDKIVNTIDMKLQEFGLEITRDRRNLHYKASIRKFMQSLKNHDYVIIVISDSYLKSKNCMFEIGELLKEKDYKSKTLQIILPDADIFDDNHKYHYIEYWESETKKMEKKLKKNFNDKNMSLINEDIKDYNDIAINLPDFLKFIISEKCMLLSDLEVAGYQTLLDTINKKK